MTRFRAQGLLAKTFRRTDITKFNETHAPAHILKGRARKETGPALFTVFRHRKPRHLITNVL